MAYELNEISDIFGGVVIHNGNLGLFKILKRLFVTTLGRICLKMICDFCVLDHRIWQLCLKKKKEVFLEFSCIVLLDPTVHKRDFVSWKMYEPW